jgi:asparagine synthase (glutamine-hydrolysing)
LKYPHTPKKLLVDSVGKLLPSEVVNRPKMGFTLPWQSWMKNELKEFCEVNIIELERRNIVSERGIVDSWEKYKRGDIGVSWSRVWHLVILNYWIKRNLD